MRQTVAYSTTLLAMDEYIPQLIRHVAGVHAPEGLVKLRGGGSFTVAFAPEGVQAV